MHHTDVDWEAVERSPEFKELVSRRNRFILPATIFFLAWFIAFILLAGYAPDFMGESVYEGLTVGYCLALSQFVMVWALSWLYLRTATRDFDPLRERAVESAQQHVREPEVERASTGRFQRPPVTTPEQAPETAAPASAATLPTTRPGGVS